MKKSNISNIILNLSFFLFFLVATFRPFISAIFGNVAILFIFIISLFLLIIILLKKRIISNNIGSFSIVLVATIFVSLYKNAYIEVGNLQNYLLFILCISYFLLLSFFSTKEKNISFILNLFYIFAILTSIVSILSVIFPDWYISKVIPLFPIENQPKILLNFKFCNERMGLSTNYSRNAFYIVIGIFISFYKYINGNKIKNLLTIILLTFSLLLLGKRSTFLFGAIAIAFSYFICNNKNIKTYFKFLGLILLSVVMFLLIIKIFPEANYIVERFTVNSNSDFSNGRNLIYNDVWNLYKDNMYFPLGWGQYAKSTNFLHPAVHNDYLQIFCETGIIGFIVIIGGDILFLKKSIKLSKTNKNISYLCLSSIIFYILYSMVELPHYDIETYMFYYLNVYIVYWNIKKEKEKLIYENK